MESGKSILSPKTKSIMNSPTILTSLLLAGSIGLVASVQAQPVTGTPYLSNVSLTTLQTPPSALYAGWSSGAGISSTPTGLNVQSSGYGSLYYVLPGDQVQTMNPSSTYAQFVFTVGGNAADYNWIGTPFRLNSDSGSYLYGGLYSGSGNPGNPSTVTWNGNTATWTVPLQPAQLTAVQGGAEHIYSIGIEFDPASLINGRTSYDVTFNSLALVSAVPEPTTFALAGAGLLLMAFRRRS